MESKPIFDFLKEVRMPSIIAPCSAEELDHYERDILITRLYDMKACLTDCLMSNPSFDVSHIKDDLILSGATWRAKENMMGWNITSRTKDGTIILNPEAQQLWKEKPEARIPAIMLNAINDAERFVNKDYLLPVSDTPMEKTTDKGSRKKRVGEKSVLTTKEVAERFGLPMNNVKDKQWRDRNGFPYSQISKGGKVVYYVDDVAEWVESMRVS